MKTQNIPMNERIATIIRDESGKLTNKERSYSFIHVAPHIETRTTERAVSTFGAALLPKMFS